MINSSKTTVKIVDTANTGNYLVINEDDYVSASMTLWGDDTKLPIISGVVTVPSGDGNYTLETEDQAAEDDVDKISGLTVGDIITFRASNTARTPIFKNGTYLHLGVDFSLDSAYDMITLECIDTDTCIIRGGRINAG